MIHSFIKEKGENSLWNIIKNNDDITEFMDTMCFFHDSCIKEIKYLSGAYVNKDLSMCPVNGSRILKVIIQRQFEKFSMVEMEFKGLKYLKLFPCGDEYTCEIMDSALIMKDGCIYWCDCGDIAQTDLESYDGTIICALQLRWRQIENCMGNDEFYFSRI